MKKIFYSIAFLFAFTAAVAQSRVVNEKQYVTWGDVNALNTYSLRNIKPGINNYRIRVQGFYTSTDGGDGLWQWSNSSTATDDSMSVLATLAGGTGRWLKVTNTNAVTLKEIGIFPDADNTYQLNKALLWQMVSKYLLLVNYNSNYKANPASGGVIMRSHMRLQGMDRTTSIISSTAYSGHNKNLFNGERFGVDTLFDAMVSTLTIHGGMTFANDTIASGSLVGDTGQCLVRLRLTDTVIFANCHITGGGTTAGIQFNDTRNMTVSYSQLDYIGNCVFADDNDVRTRYININDNIIDYYGMRHHYVLFILGDVAHYRNGENWFSIGGQNVYMRRNRARNGAFNLWFQGECRFTGLFVFEDNIWDGNGRNCGGLSLGGNFSGGPMAILEIRRNHEINVVNNGFIRKDSLGGKLRYWHGNLNEWAGYEYSISEGNDWMLKQTSVARRARHNKILNDTYHNFGMITNAFSGSGKVFSFANAFTGDSCVDNSVENCKIYVKDGQLIETPYNGDLVDILNFNYNYIEFSGDMTLGYLGGPASGSHKSLNFTGNTIKGNIGFKAFFYKFSSGTMSLNMAGNDFTRTNIDSSLTAPFLNDGGSGTLTVEREGSLYTTGQWTKFALK
ncbi:MAG: hypothetical protein ABIQ88_02425 [Chitinophagaceae bacterium]